MLIYLGAYNLILNLSLSGGVESLPYKSFVDAANTVERNASGTVHLDDLRKDDFV